MKVYKPKYKIKELYPNTYSISDNGIGQGKVYIYLLVGSRKALLIDSGYGLLDLPRVVASITDKPVICACTHGHVDHALGAAQFENAYLHSKDFEVYDMHRDPVFLTEMGQKGLMLNLPKKMVENPSYIQLTQKLSQMPHGDLKPLEEVETFDLGDRVITWKNVPGHTPGSVVFADQKNKAVFDADSAPMGAWLFLPESSSLEEYENTLEEYIIYLRQNGIEKRFVGHAGKPLKLNDTEKLKKCVHIAGQNPQKGWKTDSLLGPARIVAARGALIFAGRGTD